MLPLYFLGLELIRCVLNQSLYMDLDHVGGPLHRNPLGDFYRKRLARFRDDDARALTVTRYLYVDWLSDAGGESRLYNQKNDPHVDVSSEGGKQSCCFCLNGAGMSSFSLVRGVLPSLGCCATSCR